MRTLATDSQEPDVVHNSTLKLFVAVVFILAGVSGCSPELLPVPVTQAPTIQPKTAPTAEIASSPVGSPGLATIRMLDENDGWGISDTAVLRTADGGVTWHDVTPKNATSLGYAVSSDFLDARHAWVLIPDQKTMLAGTLNRTVDGGSSWSTFPVPFGSGVLRFLDADHGWMMASLGAGMGSMAVAVFQTTDAGSTWSQTYINDPTQHGAGVSLPLGGLKDGITAADMITAWIGGVTYAPGQIYLYETHDAGHTWKESPVKVPAGYEEAELQTRGPIFVSSEIAFLPVHVSSQNGVMLAIYISRDGGASWLLTPTLIPLGGPPDFVSEQAGFVWNGSNFYVTKDGAQIWTTISPDAAFGATFNGMDFVSPLLGFVLTSDVSGSRILYKTVDGGATWNILAR
jgi:photosystem II stability/assembly factor-like uncharacterized protein